MLEIKNLTKSYKNKIALNQISFTLQDGIYGLLGPNGAGKSTLINIITDNLLPDSGEVFWNGIPTRKLGTEFRKILGFTPQQQGLYPSFTGRRFLAYLCALKGISKKQTTDEIYRVAKSVNLLEELDKKLSAYSGGMKQRILVAQALIGNPKIMILDEPTAGLDPKERVRIRNLIQTLSKDKVILIATHVVSDIESIASKLIILKQGELIACSTVLELCERYGKYDGLEGVYMEIFGEEVV